MTRARTTYRYLFILLLNVCVLLPAKTMLAQEDTTVTAAEDDEEEAPARKKYTGGHQLTFGVDMFHPVMAQWATDRKTYEGEVTLYLKNEYYAVAEGGWGSGTVNYPDLKYNTNNYFARVGFNKSVLYRESEKDWDLMFIGLRAAGGSLSRSAASYMIVDTVWGNTTGYASPKSFPVFWVEITTGMRVELLPRIMAGWNIRGKFLMNGRSFADLAPLHIAGFGRGDKNSSFDFNLYLVYALRWDRRASGSKQG
ncbi:MAG: hypothetical protein KF744_07485 [Taibaiella sp.]|nr:hypothetical protein [Taibaiella sp.]